MGSFHPSAYCDLLAGFSWVLVAVLSGVFLLLSVAGLCFVQFYVFPSPPEMHLPKALVSEQPSSSLLPTRVAAETWSPVFTGDAAPSSLCSCTGAQVTPPQSSPLYPQALLRGRTFWWDASVSHGPCRRRLSRAACSLSARPSALGASCFRWLAFA